MKYCRSVCDLTRFCWQDTASSASCARISGVRGCVSALPPGSVNSVSERFSPGSLDWVVHKMGSSNFPSRHLLHINTGKHRNTWVSRNRNRNRSMSSADCDILARKCNSLKNVLLTQQFHRPVLRVALGRFPPSSRKHIGVGFGETPVDADQY